MYLKINFLSTHQLIKFFLIIALLSYAFLSAQITSAGELVNQLPKTITEGWEICNHYKTKTPECETNNLPLSQKKSNESVEYQSFTKNFILGKTLDYDSLSLWFKNIDDVDEVYVNNTLVGKTGRFLPDFQSGFRQQRLYSIPNEILRFNQINQLKVKTYSSRHLTGLTEPPLMGEHLSFYKQVYNSNTVLLTSATILFLITLLQVFYFIMVKGGRETLYLSLFFMIYGVISLLRSELPNELGLDSTGILQLEAFLLNLSIIIITLFLFDFFELELRRYYRIGLYILGGFSIFIVVWPYSPNIRLLFEINYIVLLIGSFLISGSGLLIGLHKKRKYIYSIYSLCSIGVALMTYDFMMHANGLLGLDLVLRKSIIPVYSAFYGVAFSLIIVHRYWNFFKGTTYDHLTGTLLRPAFFQRLTEEMQRFQRSNDKLLVAVIDIQQVKEISKNYGNSITNHLLITVSQSLSKVLRAFDLICRLSDEQFCIAVSVHQKDDAKIFIQRVYDEIIAMRQTVNQETDLFVDVRIGAVVYNQQQHLSVSHLLQDAGYALSKAQDQESTNYFITDKLTVHI